VSDDMSTTSRENYVDIDRTDPTVPIVILNRPDRRNALLPDLVTDGTHLEVAKEFAGQIAKNNEYGVWLTKRGLWSNIDAPSIRHAVELENRQQVLGTFTGNM
jgi:enoyl-CoA hydratase/carnithine racemase